MRTAVVTDGKYRAAIAAVRTLGRAGFRVIVTQTREDTDVPPPAFASRYAAETRWIPGAASEEGYADRLLSLLEEYDNPVLLCVGAAALNAVSWQRERFREAASFLIAPPAALDALNDKEAVHRRCLELNLPVPKLYQGVPDRFPVVVKPHCGEKFGLKAAERYHIAADESAWRTAVSAVAACDPAPLVQEKVEGEGFGASLLLGRNGELLCTLCHRRVREYPVTGGPSSCCESVYDGEKVRQAHRLLRSFGFQGLAMVEFKGPYILEVNPRIWGSFPLTEKADSPMLLLYARAAAGEAVSFAPWDYRTGVRMRFLLNDTLASLDLLRSGKPGAFLGGMLDFFRAKEALSARDDPAPLRVYLRNALGKRRQGRSGR